MTEMDEATRQQELADARSKKSRYEADLQRYENRHRSNNKKLERIRKVKSTIQSIKNGFEDRSDAQKQYAEDIDTYYEWSGEKQQNVYHINAEATPSEYAYYISRVDTLLDDIVDLETYYENDNLETLGLIGKVSGWINSLAGKIEKLLN